MLQVHAPFDAPTPADVSDRSKRTRLFELLRQATDAQAAGVSRARAPKETLCTKVQLAEFQAAALRSWARPPVFLEDDAQPTR